MIGDLQYDDSIKDLRVLNATSYHHLFTGSANVSQ